MTSAHALQTRGDASMRIVIQSFGACRAVTAGIACVFLLALSATASAQTALPATACDGALANPDLHPQSDMPYEDGATAFSYSLGGSFVSGGGSSLSINVGLTFQPGPDATIRLSALDGACAGGGRGGTVFTYTFSDLTPAQNTITYDAVSSEVTFNGTPHPTAMSGTPRYLFIDVWDGELPSTHASHSYLIDMLTPLNPTTP